MERRIVSGLVLTLLLTGALALAFNIQPVKAESGTIYIRQNGSIDPPTANITTTDKVIYTFTGNNYYPIVVERDNIVIDGVGYKLQGTGAPPLSYGIDLSGRENVEVRNIKISNFSGAGIYFSASYNNRVNGNTITANHLGAIVLIHSSNNIISGNTIANHTFSAIVLISSSNFNNFSENTITNNSDGIISDRSSNNNISGNTITNSGAMGIIITISHNNTVSGNTITASYFDGIAFAHCSNSSVTGNTITANSRGILLAECSNNSISGNTVTTNDYNGIRISWSSNNSVSGNTIADNMEGIMLDYYCSYNRVEGNTIANNFYGIYLWEIVNNSLYHNSFYHNNFVDNNQQVYDWAWEYLRSSSSVNFWDDGYPSGGNYWSDYQERYPDAQELDDSGIWDTPYQIDENNQDKYPLIEPWTPPPPTPEPPTPTTIEALKTKIMQLGSESEISNEGIIQSLIAKLNTAQKLADNEKVEEAKNILNNAFVAQVQNLTGIHITAEAADILVNSAEYILTHL